MAGRGRTSTFTQEQMQKLGMGAGSMDIPQVSNIPPALYPPLTAKPISVEVNNSFQVLWKDQFLCQMQNSAYHLCKFPDKPSPILAANDKKATSGAEGGTGTIGPKTAARMAKRRKPAVFHWNRMPAELLPNAPKRLTAPKAYVKKPRLEDIELRLKQLEEKERASELGTPPNKDNDTDDSEEEAVDEEEARDEEMDEENDYGNSYFDNGESYNEEDDNLDDGPVY